LLALYRRAYDGGDIHQVFDDIHESRELQAYNTMTSLLNEAFQSCVRRTAGIDKSRARRTYKTDDLPEGIVSYVDLSNRFIRLIPDVGAKRNKVEEVFRNVLLVSWCLAIGRYPAELRIPQIGSDFDKSWMIPNSQVAYEARLPNKKITAVCVPSLWIDGILSVKAEVFV